MGGPGQEGQFVEVAPSRVRYEVLALTTLMSVLLYLDRFCMGVVADEMRDDMRLGELEMGLVFSSFFFAYGLAQVPAGRLADRLGTRVVLAGCVLAWSLLTGLMGLMSGLVGLVVVRLLIGISQAGAYPVAARILSLWVPYPRRALANGLVTMGGRAGGVLAPALTAGLTVLFLGAWRPVFGIYALLGVAWAGYFYLRFRDTPAEARHCNATEVRLIAESRPPEVSDPRGAVPTLPWGVALRSRGLWLQCLSQFATNVPWVFLGTWLPTYFRTKFELQLGAAGVLSSLPAIGGMLGCLIGGWACDALTRRLGIRWGRNVLGIGSKLLAAALMLAGVLTDSLELATAALVLMSFTNDLGLGATWAYLQDAGGRYVGPLLAFANMFGNLGATISPLLLIWLKKRNSAGTWPCTCVRACSWCRA